MDIHQLFVTQKNIKSHEITSKLLKHIFYNAPFFFSNYYLEKSICKINNTNVRIFLTAPEFKTEDELLNFDRDEVDIEWEKTNVFNKKVISKVQKCARNESINLIILPFSIAYLVPNPAESIGENYAATHACVLIANKKQRSVELYDPNGAADNLKSFKGMDYIYFKNFSVLGRVFAGYKWFVQKDSCPMVGIQIFQEQENQLDGLCIAWSIYLAHLRIIFSDFSVKKFKEIVEEIASSSDSEYYFSEFIKEYISYMSNHLLELE